MIVYTVNFYKHSSVEMENIYLKRIARFRKVQKVSAEFLIWGIFLDFPL